MSSYIRKYRYPVSATETVSKRNPSMSVTIYHNPACGTSRNALAMIRQSGEEPEVIEYLKAPPDRARLLALVQAMAISVRELLDRKSVV